MNRKKIFLGIAGFLLAIALFFAYKFLGPSVSISDGDSLYIKTGATYADVEKELIEKKFIENKTWFSLASKMIGYKNIRPGRYKLKKGMNVVSLVRMLRNGKQTPVNLVITKLRTRESFAARAAKVFECDSVQIINFIGNNDSLKSFGLDTNTVMAAFMPYTYTHQWNTTPQKLFGNIYSAYKTFWNHQRTTKADSIKLTPLEVSTLASIIEEETNKKEDKYNIASTYLNRIRTGMPLQADPTVKYAMKNFGLTRILYAHLRTPSPYNTYMNTGLPPGPICTPSVETIEAVLNAPKTDYLYFVADSSLDGSSVFAATYTEHLKYAKQLHQALDRRDAARKATLK
jgi:UPF0755 protein